MITIDMQRIREALPKRAIVTLKKTSKGTPYIDIKVYPSLIGRTLETEIQGEKDIEQIFEWHREIIGRENLSEFYTEETGSHWMIYLKRQPYEFINLQDKDMDTFTSLPITNLIQK